jgi:hypothetical protein
MPTRVSTATTTATTPSRAERTADKAQRPHEDPLDGTVATMSSIPAFLVSLAEPRLVGSDLASVLVGRNLEVDLSQLGDEDTAQRLERYWQACQVFLAAPSGDAVLVRRRLYSATQADTTSQRSDLTAELDWLQTNNLTRPLVTEALSTDPDWARVGLLLTPLDGTITQDGTWSTIRFRLPAATPLPDGSTQPPWRLEQRRTVQLRISHAGWRDRRVRRLVEVGVDVDELWPDPCQDAAQTR